MTKIETAQMLALISAAYPRFEMRESEKTLSVWHEMLKDMPGDVVSVAVKRMISTQKFPPSIADIREAVAASVQQAKGTESAGEAWRKVTKAIGMYGYYKGEAAHEYLGERIWRAVEMIGGWADLCISEDSEAVRSAQFERRYNAMIQQQAEAIQIPASVSEDMARLMGGFDERLALND